jgi:hypothetical protein
MTLSDVAKDRLADVVALQPTKNEELRQRWGFESGSEVHHYLEDELGEYYYRDEDSRIRATPEAAALVGGDPETLYISPLQIAITEVLAGPDEEPMSVVATFHALQEMGETPEVDEVRSALRGLEDRGLVEIVQKTVPTFRLAQERSELDVEVLKESALEA